jgi:hypothetical protein
MVPLKAHVRGGHLVVDQPADLPEGSEVELVPVDGWDELDDEDRRRLHEALEASEEDVALGRVRPAEEVLTELRRR